MSKMPREKFAINGFGEDVKAEIAPVQFDAGVVVMRRGKTGLAEKFTTENLAKKSRILLGVIEKNFRVTVEAGSRKGIIEIYRKAWPVLDRLGAAAALQTHGRICIYFSTFTPDPLYR